MHLDNVRILLCMCIVMRNCVGVCMSHSVNKRFEAIGRKKPAGHGTKLGLSSAHFKEGSSDV